MLIVLQEQRDLLPHLRFGLVDIPSEAQHLLRMQQNECPDSWRADRDRSNTKDAERTSSVSRLMSLAASALCVNLGNAIASCQQLQHTGLEHAHKSSPEQGAEGSSS